MNIKDYHYPEERDTPRPRASQAVAAESRRRQAQHRRRATHDTAPITPISVPTRPYLPFGIGASVLIVLMIGAASWQLSRMPTAKPLQITPAGTDAATEQPAVAFAAPTMTAPTANPDPRYSRQLATGVLAGFGKQPRDRDVSRRFFALSSCAGWDCLIELDDGATVWVSVEQAGAPEPTPVPPPVATVRVPVLICADAAGLNGQSHKCALDGDYNALLSQAQAEAGPPIGQPPALDPAAQAAATQAAPNGDATAYAVQTARPSRRR